MTKASAPTRRLRHAFALRLVSVAAAVAAAVCVPASVAGERASERIAQSQDLAPLRASSSRPRRWPRVAPPQAEPRPVTVVHHGIARQDDFAWLRTGWLTEVIADPAVLEPDIRRHLDAESRYAKAMLAPQLALERELLAEMRARLNPREASVPEAFGPWEYYARFEPGGQRPLHCRRPRGGGPEQILLDENKLARGQRAFSLSDLEVSPDHRLLAYIVDDDGSERHTLKVRDLTQERDLDDVIADVHGGFAWSREGGWLYYVRGDQSEWARAVYRHKLGTPVAEDQLIYQEKQEGFTAAVRTTLSGRFLVIESSDFSTSELWLLDLAEPMGAPRLILSRKAGHRYLVSDLGDRLILFTNAGGATGWKIGVRPVSAGPEDEMEEIVPHRPGLLIDAAVVYTEHLVWLERDQETGNQRIRVRRWSDGEEHALEFGSPAKVDIITGLEQNTRTVRFTYETLAQPRQVFDYDLVTRRRTLRKVQRVPGGHDPTQYVARRLQATARDGERIPVSVLYRKDTPLDGSAPVWLYGYGAYGDLDQPEFSTEKLSLVDRGFIYAVAHVRGGGEKGDIWHEAGRLQYKETTFTDFVDVAEHLIARRLTSAGRIVAAGASAGGTLVGAAANLRPDLFAAIYAESPFVDVLNSMLDRSLPLTEASFSEFGNPIENVADFKAIRAYSPYENVRAQAYPPMLVVQSLNDARVPYWESVKWVAKLRRMKTDRNPIVLVMNERGGHVGGSGRFHELEYNARAYAFALRATRR